MKKLIALLAVTVMILSMSTCAFAEVKSSYNLSDNHFIDAVGWYATSDVSLILRDDTNYELFYREYYFGTTDPGLKANKLIVYRGTYSSVESEDGEACHFDITLDTCAGIYFEQLYTWGAPDRDPRMRVISVSYCALVPWESISHPSRDADFFPAQTVQELAFDHAQILRYALERIRNKVSYTDIAFSLVGEEFTLPELQRVYEIILGQKLYKANFRKKIAGQIEETDRLTTGGKHRPSRIYRKKHLT